MTAAQGWKIVGGIVVVAIPALFNFLAARSDSAEAKIRAEVAYSTMVEQVKELQGTVHDLELAHAELKGQVHELRRTQAARVGAAPPTIEAPPSPKAVLRAPPAFEEAVREYKNAAKK